MSVWKFVLPIDDVVSVQMPARARVLSCGVQHGEVCVWAAVDTTAALVERRFRVAGTGHPLTLIDASGPFVGTVMLHGGALVFHVFDLG